MFARKVSEKIVSLINVHTVKPDQHYMDTAHKIQQSSAELLHYQFGNKDTGASLNQGSTSGSKPGTHAQRPSSHHVQ